MENAARQAGIDFYVQIFAFPPGALADKTVKFIHVLESRQTLVFIVLFRKV